MSKQSLDHRFILSLDLNRVKQECESLQRTGNYDVLCEKYGDYYKLILREIHLHLGTEAKPIIFNPETMEIHPNKLNEFKEAMISHLNYLAQLSCILDGQKKSFISKSMDYLSEKLRGKKKISYIALSNSLINYWNTSLIKSGLEQCVISPEELEERRKAYEKEREAELAAIQRKGWYLWGVTLLAPLAGGFIAGKAGADVSHILLENLLRISVDSAAAATANAAAVTIDDYCRDKHNLDSTKSALWNGAKYGAASGATSEAFRDAGKVIAWLKSEPSKSSTVPDKSKSTPTVEGESDQPLDDGGVMDQFTPEQQMQKLQAYLKDHPITFKASLPTPPAATPTAQPMIEMPAIGLINARAVPCSENSSTSINTESHLTTCLTEEQTEEALSDSLQKIYLTSLHDDSDEEDNDELFELFNEEELLILFDLHLTQLNKRENSINVTGLSLEIGILSSRNSIFATESNRSFSSKSFGYQS